jgi:alpha-beta hydrolase superfamily lysophospholipase
MTEQVAEPQDKIYQQIRECNYDIHQINIPKSKEYFAFKKETLHIRSYWPDSYPNGVVVFCHGYTSHINRPTHSFLGPEMTRNELAYIGFDFPGHGFSTGERALVSSVPDLVGVVLRILELLFSEENCSDSHFIDKKYQLKKETPLFFMGHSMGGAVALLTATSKELTLQNYNFKGVVFLCPALKVVPLPPVFRFLLDNLIAPLFPTKELPTWLTSLEDDSKTFWNDDDYIKYVKQDHSEKGLGWGGNVRFQSGSHLLSLAELALLETKKGFAHPFLMFHDPLDTTVGFLGAKEMIASCPLLCEDHKKLVILEDGGHDLLINRLGLITRESLQWIKKRIEEK